MAVQFVDKPVTRCPRQKPRPPHGISSKRSRIARTTYPEVYNGKRAPAIATYKKLIPLKPDDANVRFNFGTALFNAGKFQDAAASCREAVRLSPAFAHAHHSLGMALLRLNDTKSDQAQFAEAHRLDPSLNPPNWQEQIRYFLEPR